MLSDVAFGLRSDRIDPSRAEAGGGGRSASTLENGGADLHPVGAEQHVGPRRRSPRPLGRRRAPGVPSQPLRPPLHRRIAVGGSPRPSPRRHRRQQGVRRRPRNDLRQFPPSAPPGRLRHRPGALRHRRDPYSGVGARVSSLREYGAESEGSGREERRRRRGDQGRALVPGGE